MNPPETPTSTPGGSVVPEAPTQRRGAPAWVLPLVIVLVGALVGLAVARFFLFDDSALTALPQVEVPTDEAVRELQAVTEANPDNGEAWLALGLAATDQAIGTSDPSWYATAEDALDTAAELIGEQDPQVLTAQGKLQLSLHDFATALETGLAATAQLTVPGPRRADALGVVVDGHVELGDYDPAAVAAQDMLDSNPGVAALARASYLRQLNGDLDGAIVAMRQAVVAAGPSATGGVQTLLGDLLLHRGDLDGAEEAYLLARTPAAAAGMARVAMARDQFDRAVQILDGLSQSAPVPAVVQALAEAQQRAGDTEGLAETVELARTIATLQEAAGQVIDLELALFEATFGDADRAVELAESAYAARPDNVYAAGALAWATFQAGDTDRAQELAADATRLGTVDTAHELRMSEITREGRDQLLSRNPLAQELYIP